MSEKPILQSHLNKSRQNKFSLILTLPPILRDVNNRVVRDNVFFNFDSLQFSIYDVNIPAISVPEINMSVFGQPFNISSLTRPAFAPVSVNWTVDNEYKNYWVLSRWLNLYNDATQGLYANEQIYKNKNVNSPLEDYRTTIVVIGKDEYDNDKIKFTFIHSLITELGGISYNYRTPDEIGCSMKFVFNQLKTELLDLST